MCNENLLEILKLKDLITVIKKFWQHCLTDQVNKKVTQDLNNKVERINT